MRRALKLDWLGRLGSWRRAAEPVRAPLLVSLGLPPIDSPPGPALPRSPDPISEEALVFARDAARRAVEGGDVAEADAGEDRAAMDPLVPSISTGADLRAMLERFEQACRRREALDQAAQARCRLVEQLSAGKAARSRGPGGRPRLRLVEAEDFAPRPSAIPARRGGGPSELGLDRAVEDALAEALSTLKHLSQVTRT